MGECAVVPFAMIFFPRGFVRILIKVPNRNVVVLAFDHAAKAREITFDVIGVDAVEAVSDGVIDAFRIE